MTSGDRTLELCVPLALRARHSLEEREVLHEHLWRVLVTVTGPLREGRIASLPALQAELDTHLQPLRETDLNGNSALDSETRKHPTCECLALFLESKIRASLAKPPWSHLQLTEIVVSVEEMDGTQTGFARLRV